MRRCEALLLSTGAVLPLRPQRRGLSLLDLLAEDFLHASESGVLLQVAILIDIRISYLLYGALDDVTRDVDRLLLADADGAGNGLFLNTRVPLWLEDEDAGGGSQVQTGKPASERTT